MSFSPRLGWSVRVRPRPIRQPMLPIADARHQDNGMMIVVPMKPIIDRAPQINLQLPAEVKPGTKVVSLRGASVGQDPETVARGAAVLGGLIGAGLSGLTTWILWRAGQREDGFLSAAAYVMAVGSGINALANLGIAGMSALY